MTFSTQTLELVQGLVFPLLKSLTGFDAAEFAGEKSQLFIIVSEALSDLSTLFMLVGTALEDGKLTVAEIEAIVAEAKTIPDAIDAIVAFFDDEETPEAPTA